MRRKRLFIWVEGHDDILFFNKIIRPIFRRRYDVVEVRQYAQMKKHKLEKLLLSLEELQADCLVVADIDFHPCVTSKKQYLSYRFPSVPPEKFVVVIQEIESWYLAGLTANRSKTLGVAPVRSTNQITKEIFIELKPRNHTKLGFMLEILKRYSIHTATQRNGSFKYFMNKHLLWSKDDHVTAG
ncbi:MAG: hypothetical protein HGB19_06890 [Chlorobiales bacterium]|jgi:hypothetical protein|nr:hypothetical protein [Chlorobiales bacterium]